MTRNKLCILPKLNDCGGNPKGKWFVYFSYRNPANDKIQRFRIFEGFAYCYTKKSKYEHADHLINKYSELLKNGWNPFNDGKAIYEDNLQYKAVARIYRKTRESNKTFNHCSNMFLPEVKGMADKTYKNYVSKFRTFEAWLTKSGFAGNDINTISPTIVKDFFLYLINDQKLARITVMKYHQMLGKMFDWCVTQKFIKASPMQNLPQTTRENDQAPRPIHEDDIKKLTQKIKQLDRQLWLVVQLEYYCFLRPGNEIRLSQISWFDLTRSRITIPKTLTKTRQNKIVIIPKQLREYLVSDWKLPQFPSDYFVIGKNGMPGTEPLSENNLRNRFNKIRDDLNLPKEYKLYSFKHTGNIRCADAGIPAYHRQRQNGHASMQSLEHYLKNKVGFESDELENNFPTID